METNEIMTNNEVVEEVLKDSVLEIADSGSGKALYALGGALVGGCCVVAALFIKKRLGRGCRAKTEKESDVICVDGSEPWMPVDDDLSED